MIYSSTRSAILKNEDTSKETVYLRSKLVVKKKSLTNTVETFFSYNALRKSFFLKEVEIKHVKRENYKINKRHIQIYEKFTN